MKDRSLTKSNNNLSPWSVFQNDIWDIFNRITDDTSLDQLSNTIVPKIELKDNGSTYQLRAEIPGMDEKDINVSLKENNLIVEGEKKNEFKEDKKGVFHSEFSYGSFYRVIPLSQDVDPDKVTASYKNGILLVELGKLPEAQNKVKKIAIGGGKNKSIDAETKH